MRGSEDRLARRERIGEAGFTLVEVLVSLSLLGLMSLLLLGGFQFGARSWDRVATVSEERDRVYATHAFLRRTLGAISFPSGLVREQDVTTLPIVGTESRLRYLASWQAGPAVSGLYVFDLWHDARDGGRLMLSWEQVAGAQTGGGGEGARGTRVLLEDVVRLRLSYFGVIREAGGGVWVDRWNTRAGGLRLLNIEVDFADARRVWPPLMIAPGM